MYLFIKNAHIAFAVVSISLFVIRAYWSVTRSALLNRTWVRVVPHANDSFLLWCALYLMWFTQQFPFVDSWLTAKFIALVVYIGFGTVAIKRGKTAVVRLLFAILSTVVFAYIFAVARTHSPLI